MCGRVCTAGTSTYMIMERYGLWHILEEIFKFVVYFQSVMAFKKNSLQGSSKERNNDRKSLMNVKDEFS